MSQAVINKPKINILGEIMLFLSVRIIILLFVRETKMADKEDFNLLREKMDSTIDAYASIIDLDEIEEVRALGNDLMSVFRDFLKQVEVN